MIKLSYVKVRPQYRTRVRYRLLVLEPSGSGKSTLLGAPAARETHGQ